jgi:hypothetical protein
MARAVLAFDLPDPVTHHHLDPCSLASLLLVLALAPAFALAQKCALSADVQRVSLAGGGVQPS